MVSFSFKSVKKYSVLVFVATLFFSCQKELSSDTDILISAPDLITKINSSVSGFVTDENNTAINGAIVRFGVANATTDKYGYFEIKNQQVVREAAVVTITKAGYFNGIKTYTAKEGKSTFFRIKLIPKTLVGNINAASGGTVNLTNGLSIKLNANTIVNAVTNAAYTGTVNVAAHWLNPEAADLNNIMPGDLRGLNLQGALTTLQTYGMAAVELTGTGGELLQIVNGQKATLTMPIPSSMTTGAPSSIPLWYFDESIGLWKEEGKAVKTGNTYVGSVGHFSFWNCDVPANFVQFDVTLKNTAGNPLPFTRVKISVTGTSNSRNGYTDSSGYVSGAVPNNSNLLMEVFPDGNCNTPIYSQSFVTTNTNISLGTITISTINNLAILNGTVTNCTNGPVTNGFIILNDAGTFTRYPISNTGTFSINRICCAFPQTVTLIGEDIANSQQSANISYVILNAGANAAGNIQACGITTQQFINFTVNGATYSFTSPADTFFYNNTQQTYIGISGYRITPPDNINFNFNGTGIAVGSSHNLDYFQTSKILDSLRIITPILVNITEYGAIGQFVAGNFSGTFTGAAPANTQYITSCNFRLRRTN